MFMLSCKLINFPLVKEHLKSPLELDWRFIFLQEIHLLQHGNYDPGVPRLVMCACVCLIREVVYMKNYHGIFSRDIEYFRDVIKN